MQDEEIEFNDQRPDEVVIISSRRHPWVLAKHALILSIVALLVFISFLIWGASTISAWILVISIIGIISYSLMRWFVFANDIYILTNQRLINIDQSGFFIRRVSEAELVNIQNVSYEIKGFIKSMLNFGNIEISTAGVSQGLLLKNVENPHYVQEKIIELQSKLKKQHN